MKVNKNIVTVGIGAAVVLVTAFIFREKIRNVFIPKSKNLDAFPIKKGSVGERVYTIQEYITKRLQKIKNDPTKSEKSREGAKRILDNAMLNTGGYNNVTAAGIFTFHKVDEVNEELFKQIENYLKA